MSYKEKIESLKELVKNYSLGFLTIYEVITLASELKFSKLEEKAINKMFSETVTFNFDQFNYLMIGL